MGSAARGIEIAERRGPARAGIPVDAGRTRQTRPGLMGEAGGACRAATSTAENQFTQPLFAQNHWKTAFSVKLDDLADMIADLSVIVAKLAIIVADSAAVVAKPAMVIEDRAAIIAKLSAVIADPAIIIAKPSIMRARSKIAAVWFSKPGSSSNISWNAAASAV